MLLIDKEENNTFVGIYFLLSASSFWEQKIKQKLCYLEMLRLHHWLMSSITDGD